MKILYAEDEEITRTNYARYLSRYFDEVYEAKNGEEAYRLYLENSPDVLLLDIDMPKLDGLEVAKRVRESDKKTKIIMLTAIKDVEKLMFATELNLTKYLAKPITRKDLKEALQKAISELKEDKSIFLGDSLVWDIENSELLYKNRVIKLTKYEKLFISLLASSKNHIFPTSVILEHIWGEVEEQKPSKLKDLVKRLRKKLPFDIIENHYSQGYKLV